jgi:hypothetical protein
VVQSADHRVVPPWGWFLPNCHKSFTFSSGVLEYDTFISKRAKSATNSIEISAMDSEEHHEIEKLKSEGRHPGNEGPFYHHSFWESYKGSVKGKLGGSFIGLVIGAAAGCIAALFLGPMVSTTAAITAIGGFAAAGLFYGAQEFSETGRITGAVAAAHKVSEKRMKAFEKEKFQELQSDIRDIKQAMGLDPNAHSATSNIVEHEQEHFRTTHFDESVPRPKGNRMIFWNIAVFGAIAGVVIGLTLASGGGAAALLSALHLTEVVPAGAVTLATTVALGAVGASFGINRDVFRHIFDKTDLWFKGLYNNDKYKGMSKAMGAPAAAPATVQHAPEAHPTQEATQPATTQSQAQPHNQVNTLIYPENSVEDKPVSDTFFRDKLLASAKAALHDMDHTNARFH